MRRVARWLSRLTGIPLACIVAHHAVEKAHAAAVYGNASAPPPFRTNSYAATVGTARKIKALNSSVKVLMYWNSALHYNFYECEAQVQPTWLRAAQSHKPPEYNYSVAAMRDWWVECAVNSIRGSEGMLDGVFIDAVPKVAVKNEIQLWGEMIDRVRAGLGQDAIILDNGFYLGGSDKELAGVDAWKHTHNSYLESLASIGPVKSASSPEASIEHHVPVGDGSGHPLAATPIDSQLLHLQWIANASAQFPGWQMVGHGKINTTAAAASAASDGSLEPVFQFGLAKYLLVTSSVAKGMFLANNGGYCINEGLLDQPTGVYEGEGVGCGEPTAPFVSIAPDKPYSLRRDFEKGAVYVDLAAGTSSINCTGSTLW